MLQDKIDTASAAPIALVEREIISGLSQCKSVDEIASGILEVLNVAMPQDRAPREELCGAQ